MYATGKLLHLVMVMYVGIIKTFVNSFIGVLTFSSHFFFQPIWPGPQMI